MSHIELALAEYRHLAARQMLDDALAASPSASSHVELLLLQAKLLSELKEFPAAEKSWRQAIGMSSRISVGSEETHLARLNCYAEFLAWKSLRISQAANVYQEGIRLADEMARPDQQIIQRCYLSAFLVEHEQAGKAVELLEEALLIAGEEEALKAMVFLYSAFLNSKYDFQYREEEFYLKALAAARKSEGHETSDALMHYILCFYQHKNPEETISIAGEQLSMTEQRYGANHPQTLNALYRLAYFSEPETADTYAQRMRDGYEALNEEQRNSPAGSLFINNYVWFLLWRQDDPGFAETVERGKLARTGDAYGRKSISYAFALLRHARMLKQIDKTIPVDAYLKQAEDIVAASPGADDITLVKLKREQAQYYLVSGESNRDKARKLLIESERSARRLLGKRHPYPAAIMISRAGWKLSGNISWQQKAESALQQALGIAIDSYGAESPQLQPFLDLLRMLYSDWYEISFRLKMHRKTMDLLRDKFAFGAALFEKTEALAGQPRTRLPDALKIAETGIRLAQINYGSQSPMLIPRIMERIEILDQLGQVDDALSDWNSICEIRKIAGEDKTPFLAAHFRSLSEFQERHGQYAMTRESLEQALEQITKTLGRTHPECVPIILQLAEIRRHFGDTEKSLAEIHEALAIARRYNGRLPLLVDVLNELARHYYESGEELQADAVRKQIEELQDGSDKF